MMGARGVGVYGGGGGGTYAAGLETRCPSFQRVFEARGVDERLDGVDGVEQR